MSMKIVITTALVFLGCCINVVILEKLVSSINGVANLVTFLQFLFISVEGFIFTSKCGTRKSQIPIKDCAGLVALFFISSICNNYAYNLNVPNTLHIIIKSGSIVANMAIGIFIRKRQYSKEKYASATFITLGIVLCTLASAKGTHKKIDEIEYNFIHWCLGVILLIIALLIGAFMGILQESLYNRCGKFSNDVLYYTHLLPLPLFSFLYNDLVAAFKQCSDSPLWQVPLIGSLSSAWILLAVNVFTQYLCIRSVYTLTSECMSLTVTLVLTLRKFLSLVLSVVFFDNLFTVSHWIGSFFVFLGTLLFFDVFKGNKTRQASLKTD